MLMRVAALMMTLLLLAGCNQSPTAAASGPKSSGRFAGIGVFETGRLWREMERSDSPKDRALATLQDDEHVIVVLDSHTGEIRQCGDHSGYCIAMNPWAGASPRNSLPAKLARHAADLDREADAAAEETQKQ